MPITSRAVRRVELDALGEHLRHDGGRAHRQRAAEAKPASQPKRSKCSPTIATSVVIATCASPRPNTARRIVLQLRQAEFEADREHQEDDAEFGQIAHVARRPAPSASACGPTAMPTTR